MRRLAVLKYRLQFTMSWIYTTSQQYTNDHDAIVILCLLAPSLHLLTDLLTYLRTNRHRVHIAYVLYIESLRKYVVGF